MEYIHDIRRSGGAPGRRALPALLALLLALLLAAGCAAPPESEDARTMATEAPTANSAVTTAPGDAVATQTAPDAATASPVAPATFTPEPPAPTSSATTAPTATAPAPTAAPPAEPRRLALLPVAEANRPLYLTHAGDGSGRAFVVEKRGVVRILQDGVLRDGAFLDIRDRVRAESSEQGLLGLAFAPDYSQSAYFFVNYTNAAGDTVIARFRVSADPDVADPGSEFPILEIEQPAPNHNGGHLAFGPDGYLWIGTGDGGAANDRFGNGQNPRTLLGKMLRIDVTTDPTRPYLVPANNPWVTADWNGQDVRDEVWAVGLRNPWRYSFDRATGDLWIADVGQNQYEEINRVAAGSAGGLNFGWPIMEGQHCFPESAACDRAGLEIPLAEYPHAGHCSVTGGYVYRGSALPELTGAYLYGDYCSGVIWALSRQGDQWVNRQVVASGLALSSFGEDEAGEIYVTDLGGGVYRLVAE